MNQNFFFVNEIFSLDQKVSPSKKLKLTLNKYAILKLENFTESESKFQLIWNGEPSFDNNYFHGIKNNIYQAIRVGNKIDTIEFESNKLNENDELYQETQSLKLNNMSLVIPRQLVQCNFKFQTLKEFILVFLNDDKEVKIKAPKGSNVCILNTFGEKVLALISITNSDQNDIEYSNIYLAEIFHHHTGKIEKPEEICNDSDLYHFEPIGIFESVFPEKNGTPRQGSIAPNSRGRLKILKPSSASDALEGLDCFSHIWLIFVFHRNAKIKDDHSKIRAPRLSGKKIGIYASRTPHRPNPIGLTSAKIDRIEKNYLYLSGVDLLDQTPILDIKPYVSYSDIIEKTTLPTWIEDPTVGNIPEENITFSENALKQLENLLKYLKFYNTLEDIQSAIIQVLQSDPRPVYMRKKQDDKLYGFRIDAINVRCSFDKDKFHIEDIELW